jgi:leader peptidase (prepilin peptidase)/N-methyltransferase
MNKCLIFFIGSCLASLYHVIGYRMPKGENWLTGHSRCPKCQTPLKLWQLIPLLSYSLQRGSCQSCRVRISWVYPIFEAIGGFFFLIPYLIYPEPLQWLTAWLFLSLLLIITISDFYYQLILNRVLTFFLGLFLFLPDFSFIGMIIGFLTMALLAQLGKVLLGKEALGGGDVKLYALIGGILGPVLVFFSLFIASFLALIYAVAFKSRLLPFGPFIAAASYFCLFLGPYLLEKLFLSYI